MRRVLNALIGCDARKHNNHWNKKAGIWKLKRPGSQFFYLYSEHIFGYAVNSGMCVVRNRTKEQPDASKTAKISIREG